MTGAACSRLSLIAFHLHDAANCEDEVKRNEEEEKHSCQKYGAQKQIDADPEESGMQKLFPFLGAEKYFPCQFLDAVHSAHRTQDRFPIHTDQRKQIADDKQNVDPRNLVHRRGKGSPQRGKDIKDPRKEKIHFDSR